MVAKSTAAPQRVSDTNRAGNTAYKCALNLRQTLLTQRHRYTLKNEREKSPRDAVDPPAAAVSVLAFSPASTIDLA